MFPARGFARPRVRLMKVDQNRHDLAGTELARTIS
jgi:hypothetical protein